VPVTSKLPVPPSESNGRVVAESEKAQIVADVPKSIFATKASMLPP
jgi:hypothetical protein